MKLSKRLAIVIFLFSLVLSATVGGIGYKTFMKSVLARYEEFAVSILNLALSYIDGDDMQICLKTGEKSAKYEETQKRLNNIKETTGVKYLYSFTPVDGKIVYIVCAFTKAEGGQNTLLDVDEYPDELYRLLAAITEGIHIIPNNTDEYGYVMSAFAVIENSQGEFVGIVGVDIDMHDIIFTLHSYILTVLISTLLFVVLFTCLVFLYLRRKITLPIQTLSKISDNFVNQESGVELKPLLNSIKTGDEIEVLSKSMGKMTADIITYINNLQAVTAEKERIGAELNIATRIQASMLPCIFPPFPNYSELDIYALMLPAKEVGGDFYDFFLVDDHTLVVVIADVSGKGIPAALFMVIAKTLIKNNAQSGKSPSEVFKTVNNMLCENNDTGMFVTAFMGYLEIKTGKFTFVNAGHNPPVLRSGENCGFLKINPGLILAGMEGVSFKESEIILQKGDELFLYTDGITEAMNGEKELFGNRRLFEVMNECFDLQLKEFVASIKNEVDRFAAGEEQADDITMLALRFNH
ncbi:MAG: SpoIIE family protein phosphatase [Chitinispirillales bacterium]|jgi:sigma-B regulation protein RsbU (phosphoserine phosphatase)|nr:SpoIIE family protein phosphatase [Chitinispirillales bacterium]